MLTCEGPARAAGSSVGSPTRSCSGPAGEAETDEGTHGMAMVTAIIKPARYEDVRNAIVAAGSGGMMVSEIRGFGRQLGRMATEEADTPSAEALPKLKIEVAVSRDGARRIVEAIASAAGRGLAGDGKIFVTPIDRVVRLRTGEDGTDAL